MATRLKTIEYACQSAGTGDTKLASAVDRTFPMMQVYIPERISPAFTFKNAIVDAFICGDTLTTTVNVTAWAIGVSVRGAAYTTNTVTDTITQSGENQSYNFFSDFTSHFNTNFTTTGDSVYVRLRITGTATNNCSAKLILTYEYGDTVATKIKTARIPIEGITGALTNALAELGTNQVPLLDTFLPEASKTYRDIFFECEVNEGTLVAGTNERLSLSLDAEAASTDKIHQDDGVSARIYRRLWKRTDMTTSGTHAFKACCTTVANMPFRMLGAVLYVTYEYNEASTTQVLNSIMIPCGDEPGYPGNTTSADQSAFQRKFYIEEPGRTGGDTVTLVQSGLKVRFIDSGAVTLSVGAGAQTARAYSNAATVVCGDFPLMHRIDSGGAAGAGLTITRGENTLTTKWFSGSATAGTTGTFVSMLCYLNYVSGKSSQSGGTCNHAHSVTTLLLAHAADVWFTTVAAAPIAIPETQYRCAGVTAIINSMRGGTTQTPDFVIFSAERAASEGAGSGWEELYNGQMVLDSEIAPVTAYARLTPSFLRWAGDPDTSKLNIETSRTWKVYGLAVRYYGIQIITTYSTIKYTIGGVVSGYGSSPVGTGYVKAWRKDNGEYIGGDTIISGDSYSITWYDNYHPVFAEFYEDATHTGASIEAVATGSP